MSKIVSEEFDSMFDFFDRAKRIVATAGRGEGGFYNKVLLSADFDSVDGETYSCFFIVLKRKKKKGSDLK